MLRVLIIGAAGVFGSRLSHLLASENGVSLILAGRTLKSLEAVAEKLASKCTIAMLDRDSITGEDLRRLECHVVIDAAGPFQTSNTRVIEAALAAGVHYIDLADGRDFVRDIVRFEPRARAEDIAIITGASSIPALSHAVIDSLVHGWQEIDTISVGIFPGNRAPRGLAVVESILSYVGKPVRVFRNGAWQAVPGWGMLHRISVPFIGPRWASVCDTPDQDLLVARYHPKHSAEFFAGLELTLLHTGLWLLSLPVRWGWIKSLLPIAKPMLTIAKWFLAFGSDKGAMTINVKGLNAEGHGIKAEWFLNADANRGPFVPTLAAVALIRKFRDGSINFRGASACVGLIMLQDFQADFERLGIKTSAST